MTNVPNEVSKDFVTSVWHTFFYVNVFIGLLKYYFKKIIYYKWDIFLELYINNYIMKMFCVYKRSKLLLYF